MIKKVCICGREFFLPSDRAGTGEEIPCPLCSWGEYWKAKGYTPSEPQADAEVSPLRYI